MRALALIFAVTLAACTNSNAAPGGHPVKTISLKPAPCPQNAPAEECPAFEMILTGRNGKAPNANDLKFVAGVVGSLISDLKVQNYFLLERYADGGFHACLDPVANGGYAAAVYAFNTFRVGNETHWDLHPAKACTGGE